MTFPFTFEALGLCLCAMGTYAWTELMLDARSIAAAAFHAWMILICFAAMFAFAVRWVQLP